MSRAERTAGVLPAGHCPGLVGLATEAVALVFLAAGFGIGSLVGLVVVGTIAGYVCGLFMANKAYHYIKRRG